MPLINQQKIDGLASFVEACGELEREPFFGKDEKLGSRAANSTKTWFTGDRFHFRSALISFRRIWMPKEPSHWRKIADLLIEPFVPAAIASVASHEIGLIQAEVDRPVYPTKIPANRTIELWLNTVFAHGGIDGGKNKRLDFEAAVAAHGHASFEMGCRWGVRIIGGHFLNLSRLAARPALLHLEATAGLKPSFQIGAAFGTKLRERTADGHVIIRQASSEFFREEALADRFARILGRSENDGIRHVFDSLNCSRTELLRLVLLCDTLPAILQHLNGSLRLACMDGDVQYHAGMCSSSGIASTRVNVYLDNIVETDVIGAAALDRALQVFRRQLLREKSCSL